MNINRIALRRLIMETLLIENTVSDRDIGKVLAKLEDEKQNPNDYYFYELGDGDVVAIRQGDEKPKGTIKQLNANNTSELGDVNYSPEKSGLPKV